MTFSTQNPPIRQISNIFSRNIRPLQRTFIMRFIKRTEMFRGLPFRLCNPHMNTTISNFISFPLIMFFFLNHYTSTFKRAKSSFPIFYYRFSNLKFFTTYLTNTFNSILSNFIKTFFRTKFSSLSFFIRPDFKFTFTKFTYFNNHIFKSKRATNLTENRALRFSQVNYNLIITLCR